jgi:deazaflavin-dependent oxidoreductase (nitroreductase family)
MRKLSFLAATALALYVVAEWWRAHRRVGVDFMNRTVNPWLERRGVLGASRGELGLIEHVGRTSGTVRQTPIHPMPIAGGFRIIVPVGERSEWARNVLAAGRCRLLIGDRSFELDEPVLETAADVPDLAPPVRALFGWLGFRYLRLRTFDPVEAPTEVAAPADAAVEAVEAVAVPA